jgi:hypothetical protein
MVRLRRAEHLAAFYAGKLAGLYDVVGLLVGEDVDEVADCDSLPEGAGIEGALIVDPETQARLMRLTPLIVECSEQGRTADDAATRLSFLALGAAPTQAATELAASTVAVLEAMEGTETTGPEVDPPPRPKRSHASPLSTCHASTAPPRGLVCHVRMASPRPLAPPG